MNARKARRMRLSAEASKRRADRLKAAGVCVACARVSAETGKIRCQVCLGKHAEYCRRRDRDAREQSRSKWRRQCQRFGKCIDCGGRAEPPRSLGDDKECRLYCTEHRISRARRHRKHYAAKSSNRCGLCREPGHKRPTCPRLLEQQRDQVQMSTGLGNWSW